MTSSTSDDSGLGLAPPAIGSNPLAFSAHLFRELSPELFLQRHLLRKPPIRPNGRVPSQDRNPTLTTASLSHANGSAVVRVGDTAVVCGIRGELLTLSPGDNPSLYESYTPSTSQSLENQSVGCSAWGGLVVINVELSTGCSKKHPPGPPGDLCQALANTLNELANLTKPVDLASLRIFDSDPSDRIDSPVRGYWVLYADISCISLDGNLIDAAWFSFVAALNSASLPLAAWIQDEQSIICNQDFRHPLVLRCQVPIVSSFVLAPMKHPNNDSLPLDAQDILLFDPDLLEESVLTETILIVTTHARTDRDLESKAGIEYILKAGGDRLKPVHVARCAALAVKRSSNYTRLLSSG